MKKPEWLVKLARKLDWAEREEIIHRWNRAEQDVVLLEHELKLVQAQLGTLADKLQTARFERDKVRSLSEALQTEVDRLKFVIANSQSRDSGLILDQSGHTYREVTVEIIKDVPEFITRLHAEIRLTHRVIIMLGSAAWEDGINQLGETVKRLLTEKHNELVEHYRQTTHLGPPGQSS